MNRREVALCIRPPRPPQLANFKLCNSLTFENAPEFTESGKRKALLEVRLKNKTDKEDEIVSN